MILIFRCLLTRAHYFIFHSRLVKRFIFIIFSQIIDDCTLGGTLTFKPYFLSIYYLEHIAKFQAVV